MPPIRLTVCLLTRDEERNIGRALRSVEGLADEVVVADAGSTDHTASIARELGARMVSHAWVDDFSAGRNAAVAASQGDWVLWLNPDEELLPESHEVVRTLVDNGPGFDPSAFGYLARLQSVPRADRLDAFTETWDLRLYRRRPEVVYVGRLHPAFPAEVAEAAAKDGLHVAPSGVVIRHHAYASTLTKAKLRWSVRLMEKELQDRPGRFHFVVEYGRALLMLDPADPKGHEVMAEAAAQVMPFLDSAVPPNADVQKVLEYLINTPPDQSRAAIDASKAAELALKWFPTSPPLLWLVAGRYFQAKQFHTAAALLDQLLRLGTSGGYDRSLGFDPRIIGPWPLVNLGQCYRAIGEPDKARRCFELLLTDPEFKDQAVTLLANLAGDRPAAT